MTSSAANGMTPKVVALNARGQGISPGERIFGECRERLLDAMTQWLRAMGAVVAEELFALADTSRDRTQQARYLDLRGVIEKDWSPLAESFRREFCAEALRCQKPEPDSDLDRPLELPDFAGLTLVDDDELTRHIVVREFAAQLSEACADELYTLERRVAALLGWDETSGRSNPLAPPVLCHALAEACNAIVGDRESRVLLLRRLQHHLHAALPAIYQRTNGFLVDRGILPDLKRSYWRPGTADPASASVAAGLPSPASFVSPLAALQTPPLASSDTTRPGQSATLSGEAILLALQRLALTRSANVAQAVASSTQHGATAIVPQATEPPGLDQLLLSSLDELQHAPDSPHGETIVNRVRQLRDSQSGQGTGGLEAVTIDIIAMLFDFIFDDPHVPVAIKALVSRLQIPVLKVAMLDPAFFADRQHPTRRFLGSISGVSIRWGETVDDNDPFFRKLAEIVERIQNEFESDVGIFGSALAELEDFVARRQNEEEDTALTAANAVNLREQQNAAWQRAQHAVMAFCQQARPPLLIADFLAEFWVAVLQAAAINDDDATWQANEQLMYDLAWSVVAKKSSDERLKLIALLPDLLARLKRGLLGINARAEQCTTFFDALLPYHAAALKGETVVAATVPTEAEAESAAKDSPPPASSEGDLLVTRSIDDGVEVEEIMLVGAAPIWRPDDQDSQRQVSGLVRGDWVEFCADDDKGSGSGEAKHRERLNWISPQGGILLFSNQQSAKAISITPEALARKIRDGQACIVRHEAIFERALNGALESAHVLG